ncbi:hypothetical protein N0V88_003881 [Collariella sp. IMI 366227]|nr:hypothetical protein N0V88_003881 [Collariella sp. IMI 366227]
MPFGEDFFGAGPMSPLVQSDLLGSLEPESPSNQVAIKATNLTIVTLDDREDLNGDSGGIPEADMDIDMGGIEDDSIPSAPTSTLEKRGRPSLSGTPAKSVGAQTPRSTKSIAAPKSAGRSTGKRKSAEVELEEKEAERTPARRAGRPRSTGPAASARLAAKAASKPGRGRPKLSVAKPTKKAGRPKKEANGEVAEDEYEVEDIVDSVIEADTMEHMHLIKWKNYPASDNTWEPKKNLKGSLDLVRKPNAKKKKKERAAAAASKVSARKAAVAPAGEAKKTRGKPKAVQPVKAVNKSPKRPAGRERRATLA